MTNTIQDKKNTNLIELVDLTKSLEKQICSNFKLEISRGQYEDLRNTKVKYSNFFDGLIGLLTTGRSGNILSNNELCSVSTLKNITATNGRPIQIVECVETPQLDSDDKQLDNGLKTTSHTEKKWFVFHNYIPSKYTETYSSSAFKGEIIIQQEIRQYWLSFQLVEITRENMMWLTCQDKLMENSDDLMDNTSSQLIKECFDKFFATTLPKVSH